MRLKTFLTITSLIAIDQGLKALFLFSKKATLINDSSVFLLPIKQVILIILSCVLLGLLVGWYIKRNDPSTCNQLNKEKNNNILQTCIILIISGGASNTIDRVLHGGVVDIFLSYQLHWNIADVYIVLGATIMVVHTIFQSQKAKKQI